MQLKIRKIGNALATIWPKALLSRLNVGEGDALFAVDTPDGILLAPYDPKFEKTMAIARSVMARDRDALKELAR